MHKIYFEKRCIIICSPDDPALSDPNVIRFSPGEDLSIHALVEMVEASDTLHRTCIPTTNVEGTYRRICEEFKEVNAGGGLVSNRRGDFLLISRNGLWDLPKGHWESGETIEECALREVAEETGVSPSEILRPICNTYHTYNVYGTWELKCTHWFLMRGKSEETSPQHEEGIVAAEWLSPNDVCKALQNSYPTIRKVFASL